MKKKTHVFIHESNIKTYAMINNHVHKFKKFSHNSITEEHRAMFYTTSLQNYDCNFFQIVLMKYETAF